MASDNSAMTLDEALELPFGAYLAWCHAFAARLAERDATAAAVFDIGGEVGRVLREAQWARRYYLCHAAKVQPVQAAERQPETVRVYGVRADGGTELVGVAPMPPVLKMHEIVEGYFGRSREEGDEADSCLSALHDFHAWLVRQGWAPPQGVDLAAGGEAP